MSRFYAPYCTYSEEENIDLFLFNCTISTQSRSNNDTVEQIETVPTNLKTLLASTTKETYEGTAHIEECLECKS